MAVWAPVEVSAHSYEGLVSVPVNSMNASLLDLVLKTLAPEAVRALVEVSAYSNEGLASVPVNAYLLDFFLKTPAPEQENSQNSLREFAVFSSILWVST